MKCRKEEKVDKSAIKPSLFNIQAFKATEEADKKGVTEEEQHLYSLSGTKGWEIVSEYAKRVMAELDEANNLAISNGVPFEEIGKNTVIISLAKNIVDRILNIVSDAKEACEANGQ
jgi:hypothetical protein